MRPSGWLCRKCGIELLYYNTGFDDGFQCPRCKVILENHGEHHLRRHADPKPKEDRRP